MTTRPCGDVLIIDLQVNPASEHELLDLVSGLVADGHRKFVVNLAEMKWLDSAGLGSLAGAFTTASRLGSSLILASPPPVIKALLDHTRLATVIPVHSSEHEAIASFGSLDRRP